MRELLWRAFGTITPFQRNDQDSIRCKTLQDLAVAVVQLRKYQFHGPHEISLDEAGNLLGTAEQKATSRAGAEIAHSSEAHSSDSSQATRRFMFPKLVNAWPLCPFLVGLYGIPALLRMWIQSLLDEDLNQPPNYILTHPDIHWQNLIVGKDGSLKAIIDWDGVQITPVCAGQSYPMWLSQDWQAYRYYYNENREFVWDDVYYDDDPSEELARLRTLWLDLFRSAEHSGNKVSSTDLDGAISDGLDVPLIHNTRKSMIYTALSSASRDISFETKYTDLIYQKLLNRTHS